MSLIICTILLTITTLQIESTTTEDLKSIFQMPNRRNYDEMEILERSNFDTEEVTPPSTTPAIDTPKSYANAQVMLRFGAEKEKCACGDVCQCRSNSFYVPVITPLPYCWCLPPNQYYTPPLPPPTMITTPSTNSDKKEYQEKPQQCSPIKNNNHPQILKTVTLTDEAIKPVKEVIEEDLNKIKPLEEISNKIEPTQLTPNLKIINLDLSKVNKLPKKELDDCLIEYSSPQQRQAKLLVSYPIFNKPQNQLKPPVVKYSGYSFSTASGYYEDPAKAVIYKKPTILQIYDRNITPIPGYTKYICVPLVEPAPVPLVNPPVVHLINTAPINLAKPSYNIENNYCPSCARYVGELNEKSV